jgi:hypothetical protein
MSILQLHFNQRLHTNYLRAESIDQNVQLNLRIRKES